MEKLKKVQLIALSYYSRKDVQKEIFDFCKNREVIPNYNNEFFGKRPNCLDYPGDIFNLAKKGATSFHCSEELWENPLDIKTEMSSAEYNQLRTGWDMLIDVDSKYFDYSKIAAKILIDALRQHNIKNIGIKFSGSKGFHIIIPFSAFPEKINNVPTKEKFPEYPRAIAQYLKDYTSETIATEILRVSDMPVEDIVKSFCKACSVEAEERKLSKYVCSNIQCRSIVESTKSNRKEIICPSCHGKMFREELRSYFVCPSCRKNSNSSPQNFEQRKTIKGLIDTVDIALVSPRHLFRAPYSLHEKTSLVSVVISPSEISDFEPSHADPLVINKLKNFYPTAKKDEAKKLLIQAIDYQDVKKTNEKNYSKSINLKGLKITEEMFPPEIKKLLLGMKHDGRKRALSLLLSFFSSLSFDREFIEAKISGWNKKNYKPLKEGYIKSQINWHIKNKRMPPNYDKPIYKELNILNEETTGLKNPVNYTIRKALSKKS